MMLTAVDFEAHVHDFKVKSVNQLCEFIQQNSSNQAKAEKKKEKENLAEVQWQEKGLKGNLHDSE